MLVGFNCGRVKLIDPSLEAPLKFSFASSNSVISISPITQSKFAFAFSNGTICVQGTEDELDLQEYTFNDQENTFSSFDLDHQKNVGFLSAIDGQIFQRNLSDHEEQPSVFGSVQCERLKKIKLDEKSMQVYPKGAQFSIFDVETQKQVFQSRNSKGDELNVVDKPNFIDGVSLKNKGILVLSVGKVSLFDPRSQRRAVWDLGKSSATQGCFSCMAYNNEHDFYCGGNISDIFVYDMKMMKMRKVLKFHTGGIVSIAVDDQSEMLASVGMDRRLFLSDLNERTVLKKYFLSQLPSAACKAVGGISRPKKEEENLEDLDSDNDGREDDEEKEEKEREKLKKAIKNEELLWHNNLKLQYEKKVKRA